MIGAQPRYGGLTCPVPGHLQVIEIVCEMFGGQTRGGGRSTKCSAPSVTKFWVMSPQAFLKNLTAVDRLLCLLRSHVFETPIAQLHL
jgi:hypothetical protein